MRYPATGSTNAHHFSKAYLTRGVMWEVGSGCPAEAEAAALGGLTWLVDISHGNSRSWSNICHWADTMYIAYTVLLHRDLVARLPPFAHVAMYQVERDQFKAPRGVPTDWYAAQFWRNSAQFF